MAFTNVHITSTNNNRESFQRLCVSSCLQKSLDSNSSALTCVHWAHIIAQPSCGIVKERVRKRDRDGYHVLMTHFLPVDWLFKFCSYCLCFNSQHAANPRADQFVPFFLLSLSLSHSVYIRSFSIGQCCSVLPRKANKRVVKAVAGLRLGFPYPSCETKQINKN